MAIKSNTKEFIAKARKIHGNKFDYSKVIYTTVKQNVIIGCSIHGEFQQTANHHLVGRGCPTCSLSLPQNEFVNRAIKVHGKTYTYRKVDYRHMHRKVVVTCRSHGDFIQTPSNHLKGHGCPSCGRAINNVFSYVNYKLGKRVVKVQGYEPYALDHLINNVKIDPKDIRVGKEVPVIRYFDPEKNKERLHFPDILIESKNRLVEVKSRFLFLRDLRVMKLKRAGAKKQGFKYSVCVIDKKTKEKTSLPSNWYNMDFKELRKCV